MLAVGLAVALGVSAPALDLDLDPPPGMMTVGRSQAIILGAVLTEAPNPDRPACALDLSLVDSSGNVVRDRAGVEVKKQAVLRGNVAAELSVHTNDVLAPRQTQKVFRWVVEETPGVVSCRRSLVVSEEIGLLGPGGRFEPSVLKQLKPSGGEGRAALPRRLAIARVRDDPRGRRRAAAIAFACEARAMPRPLGRRVLLAPRPAQPLVAGDEQGLGLLRFPRRHRQAPRALSTSPRRQWPRGQRLVGLAHRLAQERLRLGQPALKQRGPPPGRRASPR